MNMKEHFMKQRKGAHASERHVRFVVSLKRNQQTPKVETSGAAVYGSFIYILEFHTPASGTPSASIYARADHVNSDAGARARLVLVFMRVQTMSTPQAPGTLFLRATTPSLREGSVI